MTGSGRSAVVLGSTGMLGQALCRVLADAGYRLIPASRESAEHPVDAAVPARLLGFLQAMAPDLVINAAAETSLEACERDPGAAYAINAGAVATLAEYCSRRGCKLVHVSTDHYFTGDGDQLHDERAPVSLLNEYARTKYAGEAFAATCGDSLIIRTNLVGFRGWPGKPTFVEWIISSLHRQEPITMFGDFFTSSLDVQCFATTMVDLAEQNASGLLNVACREAASKQEFILRLARRLGLDASRCRPGSVTQLQGARRAESLGLNVARAESVLGYQLPDVDQVIEQLARSYEEGQHALR